jgi:hypothetical protein
VSSLSRTELLRLARAGAEARVSELHRELDALYRSFPDLRRRRNSTPLGDGADMRKRRSWSAAQRRAVAERMRKYWAAKRAAQKK